MVVWRPKREAAGGNAIIRVGSILEYSEVGRSQGMEGLKGLVRSMRFYAKCNEKTLQGLKQGTGVWFMCTTAHAGCYAPTGLYRRRSANTRERTVRKLLQLSNDRWGGSSWGSETVGQFGVYTEMHPSGFTDGQGRLVDHS